MVAPAASSISFASSSMRRPSSLSFSPWTQRYPAVVLESISARRWAAAWASSALWMPPSIAAVRSAAQGRTYLNPELGARMAAEVPGVQGSPDNLSQRELEVLRLLAQGLSNAEIAARAHAELVTAMNSTAPFASR